MPKIVYYVATSLDGYISGQDGDVSKFAAGGEGVDKYLSGLSGFGTVIMGRKTYEFGYKYGLVPGQPAYEHMQHFIFSNSLSLKDCHDQVHIVPRDINHVKELKEEKGTDIYLCGGSVFAGELLNNQLIDELKIKLSPVIFGRGLPLFSGVKNNVSLTLTEIQDHDHGMKIKTYTLNY